MSQDSSGEITQLQRVFRLALPHQLTGELEDLRESLDRMGDSLDKLHFGREEDMEAWGTLKERLDRMEKQIQRVGKEQFKTNTLVESTQQRHVNVLETLRLMDEERGQELQRAREALRDARTEGRTAFFTRLLPAMDSLDEALAAGRRQLTGWIPEEGMEQASPQPLPVGQRLKHAWRLLKGSWTPWELDLAPRERLRPEALAAWLKGLDLLRERLIEHLAEEDIRLMDTLGESFDPHLHLAFETVSPEPGQALGTVVREVRPGYLLGDTVLRYAEVVVAK